MYRQPYLKSFRYMCGLYQQSHGAKCKHNCVDGLLATRFLLGCVRQRLWSPALRAKLEQKLRAIAERELGTSQPDTLMAAKQAALTAVRVKRERAEQNLALAEGRDQYRAVAKVFENLKKQEKALEIEMGQLEQATRVVQDVDAEVTTALVGLDRMAELAAGSHDLGGVGRLFQQLNVRLFLQFTEGRWKKRIVNKIAGGVVTFGASAPPVALYEGRTDRRSVKGPAVPEGTAGQESPGNPGAVPSGDGNSLGNVNRGEPRCPFVIEIIGLPLALSVFPQVYDFSGDAVLQLVEPGLYKKGWRTNRGAG